VGATRRGSPALSEDELQPDEARWQDANDRERATLDRLGVLGATVGVPVQPRPGHWRIPVTRGLRATVGRGDTRHQALLDAVRRVERGRWLGS
jgi:hypothetical protein